MSANTFYHVVRATFQHNKSYFPLQCVKIENLVWKQTIFSYIFKNNNVGMTIKAENQIKCAEFGFIPRDNKNLKTSRYFCRYSPEKIYNHFY